MAGGKFGGAEAFFTRMAIAFARSDLDQRVVIRRNAARAKKLRAGGFDPVQLSFGGFLDFVTSWELRREIRRFQPDIVLSWMNRATRYCPKGEFIHVGRLGGYYDLKYYRQCDHLIANTRDIADYIQAHGWDAERVHYLPNFVGGEGMPPVSRESLITPARVPLVLAVGRLHRNKAFDVLFEALARMSDAYLWLAGDGPERPALEAQAERLGIKPRVRFLGWRDDTPALYAAADLFVCPSRHEPLGNVIIEAWAHGVPVIATDSPGPGTLITQGATGVLVPVDDSAAMAGAMKRLLEDGSYREALTKAGGKIYQAQFTERIVVDKYLNFFHRLVR